MRAASRRMRAGITTARRLERGACGRPSRGALTRPPQDEGSLLLSVLALQQYALRPRALALDLQLRQERDERMRAHLHHGGEIELDQRLALIGRKLILVGKGARVGKILRSQLGVVRKRVQRRGELDQLRLDRRIMRSRLRRRLAAGPAQ